MRRLTAATWLVVATLLLLTVNLDARRVSGSDALSGSSGDSQMIDLERRAPSAASGASSGAAEPAASSSDISDATKEAAKKAQDDANKEAVKKAQDDANKATAATSSGSGSSPAASVSVVTSLEAPASIPASTATSISISPTPVTSTSGPSTNSPARVSISPTSSTTGTQTTPTSTSTDTVAKKTTTAEPPIATPTPDTSSSESKSTLSSSTLWISLGSVAGALVLTALIFMVVRRRRGQNAYKYKTKTPWSASSLPSDSRTNGGVRNSAANTTPPYSAKRLSPTTNTPSSLPNEPVYIVSDQLYSASNGTRLNNFSPAMASPGMTLATPTSRQFNGSVTQPQQPSYNYANPARVVLPTHPSSTLSSPTSSIGLGNSYSSQDVGQYSDSNQLTSSYYPVSPVYDSPHPPRRH